MFFCQSSPLFIHAIFTKKTNKFLVKKAQKREAFYSLLFFKKLYSFFYQYLANLLDIILLALAPLALEYKPKR